MKVKNHLFKSSRVTHQKKRLKSLIIHKKTFFKILKNVTVMGKIHVKMHFSAIFQFFNSFFGRKLDIFKYFASNKALLLICNTTFLEKIYFWPLFMSFEVTTLVGKQCFLKNSNEFRLFIYWSNFRTAEIGQTLILV